VRGVKGMSPIAKTRAAEIITVIESATPVPPSEKKAWRAAGTRAQRWAEMLLAIVQIVSEESGIAPRLLGTRADAEEFARVVDEHGLEAAHSLPALATWRREVLGNVWEGWLGGRVAVVGDPAASQGMKLLPRT
jgi:ribonuclease D